MPSCALRAGRDKTMAPKLILLNNYKVPKIHFKTFVGNFKD